MQVIPLYMFYRACAEQLDVVRHEWPGGVPVTQESLDRALMLDLDIKWCKRLLLPSARQRYDQEAALALQRYDQEASPAWQCYDKDMAPALAKRCYKDIAQAWRCYNKACGQALLHLLLEVPALDVAGAVQ